MAAKNRSKTLPTVQESRAQQSHTAHAQLNPNSDVPMLFDWFYEEFLTQLMSTGSLAETLPEEFMKITTDIDRVEYLMQVRPFMQEFEITDKVGLKSLEKANRYREEGNKLFQADQPIQSILFYNKALTYAPHPDHLEYPIPENYRYPEPEPPLRRGEKGVQFQDGGKARKSAPSKYESLAFCYANRSAALRKLSQYDECLRDISRAARFGYPKENLYKLWERKGKCYHGLRRYEMAIKCYRQAVGCLKDSGLSDNQKTLKTHELHGWIKDLKTQFVFLNFSSEDGGSDKGSESGGPPEPPPTIMGATGPIVFVPEPEPKRKTSLAVPQGRERNNDTNTTAGRRRRSLRSQRLRRRPPAPLPLRSHPFQRASRRPTSAPPSARSKTTSRSSRAQTLSAPRARRPARPASWSRSIVRCPSRSSRPPASSPTSRCPSSPTAPTPECRPPPLALT